MNKYILLSCLLLNGDVFLGAADQISVVSNAEEVSKIKDDVFRIVQACSVSGKLDNAQDAKLL